jgi:ABC-type multidrug transport system fused ATPase/permease subunit
VRDALEADRVVSIFPIDGDVQGDPDREAAASSFVSHLADVYGAPSLGQFLAAYDPERADAAALEVYFQPLGALEEGWLDAIRRRPHMGSAFRALLRQIAPLFRPYWIRGVEFVLLTLLGVALTIAVPLTIMYIVDHILPHAHGHYDDLILYVALLLVIFVVNTGTNARRTYVEHWLNEKTMTALNTRLFEHLQRLSHNYYSRTTTSNLMAMLTDDLREIRAAVGLVVGSAFYQTLLALGTAITVLILDPLLGLIVLIIVPVFAAGYVALRSRWQREAHGFQRLQSEADHIAYENFSAHGEIKAYGLQEHAIHAYHDRHQNMFGRHLRIVGLSTRFESILHIASGVGHVVVFGFGGYQVIAGNGVTIGTLFAFAHLLPLFYEPIERLTELGHTVEGAAGAFDRIDEVVHEPVQIADKPHAVDFSPLAQEIRLEHVTFGYDPGRPVLNDLSLVIPAGAEVAIVGPSGCGKSTVVNMIMRFWDPGAGRVLFDGRDLRDGTVASLRNQIGIVFPETFTFNTSVRENISIGYPEATDAEVERAAKAAQLDQYVKTLPAGYNTVLGERGVRMSSGQRQRLAIARALLRDPSVLILDEATSALDPQTESEILDTLATIGRGKTTISIRHRLAAVATADIIFVLDQGRLVEQGRHTELVKAGGLYQRLYEEQMLYLHGGGVVRVGVDVERLRVIPLFEQLDAQALDAVAERFMLERYAADEVVVRQGDPGDKLYLISRGQLDVLREHDGSEQHVNELRRGDYFGEMALLANEPRNATVRTQTPTQLYSLDADDFHELLERLPEVREAVSRTAAGRQTARSGGQFVDSDR